MSTFTPTQIRAAILRAADTFDRDHALFATLGCRVPNDGDPGCAIAYTMKYLGAEVGTDVLDGCDALGTWASFHSRMSYFSPVWNVGDRIAPLLRAYADKYF